MAPPKLLVISFLIALPACPKGMGTAEMGTTDALPGKGADGGPAVHGCGPQGFAEPPADVLDAVHAYCTKALDAMLATRVRCNGGPVEFLRARVDYAYECKFAVEAVKQGRMLFDATAGEACLQELANHNCTGLGDRRIERLQLHPPSCLKALRGQVGDGGCCRYEHFLTSECAEADRYCLPEGGRCSSTCGPLPAKQDAYCSPFIGCASGFYCDNTSRCYRYARLGEHCAGLRGDICAPDTTCEGGGGNQEGTCVPYVPTGTGRTSQPGDPCDPKGRGCDGGYTCFEGHCTPPVPNGEVCWTQSTGPVAQCLEGYCNWEINGRPSAVCVPFDGPGGLCGDFRVVDRNRDECGPYAYCDLPALPSTCKTVRCE